MGMRYERVQVRGQRTRWGSYSATGTVRRLSTVSSRRTRSHRGTAPPSGPAASTAPRLAAIATLHVVAPPLIAFLTYFCGWHSVRHLLDLGADLVQFYTGMVYRGPELVGECLQAIADWRAE